MIAQRLVFGSGIRRWRLLRAVMVVAAAGIGCASTVGRRVTGADVESPTMNDVRWDPTTATLGCASGDAELTLPRDLHDRVHVIAHDLIVVLLPQVNSALMVTVSPSFLRGKRAGVLGDFPEIWKELHRQATGVDLREGDLQGKVRARGGRVTAEYTYDPWPPPVTYRVGGYDFEPAIEPPVKRPPRVKPPRIDFDPTREPHWKLMYVEAGRCRIAAVDRAEADGRPRLTPLLDDLRIPFGLIPR